VNMTYASRTAVERAFDALIGHEIRRLNNHLPKQRKFLRDLLAENTDSTIEAVDGTELLLPNGVRSACYDSTDGVS